MPYELVTALRTKVLNLFFTLAEQLVERAHLTFEGLSVSYALQLMDVLTSRWFAVFLCHCLVST